MANTFTSLALHQRVLNAYRELELRFPELTNHSGRAKLTKLIQLANPTDLQKAIDAIPDEYVRGLIQTEVAAKLAR
jgi:hypothetical protein